MDLRDYGRILRKRWLLIVLLHAARRRRGGRRLEALQTPVYEAQTQLFVSAQSSPRTTWPTRPRAASSPSSG